LRVDFAGDAVISSADIERLRSDIAILCTSSRLTAVVQQIVEARAARGNS
jgi:hypothetical protein